jgi:hypothetical protein
MEMLGIASECRLRYVVDRAFAGDRRAMGEGMGEGMSLAGAFDTSLAGPPASVLTRPTEVGGGEDMCNGTRDGACQGVVHHGGMAPGRKVHAFARLGQSSLTRAFGNLLLVRVPMHPAVRLGNHLC